MELRLPNLPRRMPAPQPPPAPLLRFLPALPQASGWKLKMALPRDARQSIAPHK
jgi:hypothetical protein